MLVFAGLAPSSPLLLPAINEAKMSEVSDTRQAFEELAEELYAVHPDTLVIFAEAKTMYDEAFSVDVADPYVADLEDFGELGYRKTYHPDFSIIDRLQRHLRQTEAPITLSTDPKLSAGAVVPLDILTAHLPNIRIVPITPSGLDAKAHFNLGVALKHIILESKQRVAVIAAGDMSHALSKTAPAGFHKDAKKFDDTVLSMLREHNASGLLQIPEGLIANAHDTAYRQICMLLGVLDGMYTSPTILGYAAPFGVGYCVANFVL